jgi:hypothetical protein
VAVRSPTSDDVLAEAKLALEIAQQHQDKAKSRSACPGWDGLTMGNQQDAVHILKKA